MSVAAGRRVRFRAQGWSGCMQDCAYRVEGETVGASAYGRVGIIRFAFRSENPSSLKESALHYAPRSVYARTLPRWPRETLSR